MLKHVFIFDHQNHSRYLSYQHVLSNHHQYWNSLAFQDFFYRGFKASYSGNKIATVHGDIVREHFNKETEGTAGPLRRENSTKQ